MIHAAIIGLGLTMMAVLWFIAGQADEEMKRAEELPNVEDD